MKLVADAHVAFTINMNVVSVLLRQLTLVHVSVVHIMILKYTVAHFFLLMQ